MNSPEPNSPLPSSDPLETIAPPGPMPPARKEHPEDLRTRWGWTDLFLLLCTAVITSVFLSNLLSLAFYAHGISAAALKKSGSESSLFVLLNQAILYAALLAYLYIRTGPGSEIPFWQTVGWRPINTGSLSRRAVYAGCILLGSLLCVIVTFASDTYGNKTQLPIQNLFQDRRTSMIFILMAVLIAPIVEETIFRGYIYPVLARTFGIGWGVLATGTIFGLLHAPQLWGGWVQIALLILVGVFFTYARAVSRTVTASYLLHLGYNSFIALAFLLLPNGYRSLPMGR
jgi:membrane protease YdiL (CAAX protease family)